MEVKQHDSALSGVEVVTTLLRECSAVVDYRTLRDSLPRRLTRLLGCRCVLLYQRIGTTLQFAAGTFDDQPGWSATLLAVAHINPIEFDDDLPEARALRERRAILWPASSSTGVAAPLLYRQHIIGVLVALRTRDSTQPSVLPYWQLDELPLIESVAGIVALCLENTRLLERDRARIHELSLLKSISGQINYALYEEERISTLIIQYTREITSAEQCAFIDAQSNTASDMMNWITPTLRSLLLQHYQIQRLHGPIIIERSGKENSTWANQCLAHLPAQVKTFFLLPLISGIHTDEKRGSLLARSLQEGQQKPRLLGMVAGIFHQPRTLRDEELLVLQVLINQSSAVLENIRLMAEVVEARNEARKLLRQVLDDQRHKERMEEEKRRLDRLATLGEMAASVAHEVRNPLASIKTSIQMAMDDLATNQIIGTIQAAYNIRPAPESELEIRESMAIVLQEVERLDNIVHDLLLFARPRRLHRRACDIVALCEHVLHMLQTQCAEAGIIVTCTYDDVPELWVDMAQIEQVLLNLCINAIQAMNDGGTLTVACHQCSSNDVRQGREQEQLWIELLISDTGSGIKSEEQERVFQPFFTTKAHGIGLGLPISRRFVEDHGGSLHVESCPGTGSTFAVRLPIPVADGKEHILRGER